MAGELNAAVTPCRLIRAPENSFVLTRKKEAHAVDMSDSWTPAGLSQPCHEPLLFTFQTTKSCSKAGAPTSPLCTSAPEKREDHLNGNVSDTVSTTMYWFRCVGRRDFVKECAG